MEGTNLERVITRSGETVFKISGRLTASSYDPVKEAKDWLASLAPVASSSQRLVVLGVGSAYHLLELRQQFAEHRILAIDVSANLIEGALVLHGARLAGIEMLALENEENLLNSERVRSFLRAPIRILEHASSQHSEVARYREIKARLVAREPLFFADWIRRHERFARLFPLQAVSSSEENRLLSIKDVSRFLDVRGNAQWQDVLIVKILRELVK